NVPDFGFKVDKHPYLLAGLSSNRRRRCFENVTTVTYANTGFAPAANARVYVQFQPEVIFKSANLQYTREDNGNYVFEVGTLLPGQQGVISITDSVSCADPAIRGLTVCTKAWIISGNTFPLSPTYNRADMMVEATATQEK